MLLDLKKLKEKYDLKINGVLHIGAHYGQEFTTYQTIGVKDMIFFEPLPDVFNVLKENIRDNAILMNTALGNIVGTVDMNVESANQGMSSSILDPHLHKNQYPHIVFNNKVNVPITKLDLVMESYDKIYNFICIDVQGYELEVFKGGEETLKHVDYIMTEVNRDEVYKNCVKVEELDSFLSKFGFKRVETTWDGVIWGDALYIKN